MKERRKPTAVGWPSPLAVFHAEAQAVYVNIADPAEIAVVDSRRPDRIAHTFAIPSVGPHGPDLEQKAISIASRK